jgi:tripartite-type tricarboxylate transporter receptor subunit TctC
MQKPARYLRRLKEEKETMMNRTMLRKLCVASLALGLTGTAATADEAFYKGKQINFIISADGAYEAFARMISRHWVRTMPGDPTFVVQHMPGAGGLRATNWLYNVAPKDGLTIGMINNTIVFDPVYGNTLAQFDPRKFNWLGTPSQETGLFVVWHSVPVMNLEDAKKRELILAASGAGSTPAFFARVLSNLFDFRVKIIPGYKGQTDAFLAMERGENDGHASPFWSTLRAVYPQWLTEKKIRPLVYYGGGRNPDIPAPYALDLLKDPERRAVMELAQAGLAMGRPMLAPPGVDTSKVAALRTTLNAVFANADFLAECKKQQLDCSSPLTGQQMHEFVESIYRTPKEAQDRLAQIYMQGQGK